METFRKPLKSKSTPYLLLGIWRHLSSRRRIQFAVAILLMLLSGVAELLSLGAVMPFLTVLTDPELLSTQPIVQDLANWFGFSGPSNYLFPATCLFAFTAILAAIIRLINLWLNGQLVAAVGSDLSCEAYKRTLYQPYEIHLKQNSSAVITASTNQINLTVSALKQFLLLITSIVVASALLLGLLLIDASVAVAATFIFGFAYVILSIISRRELRNNGNKITHAAKQQIKALQEGLGSIRDVLLDHSQNFYLDIYRKADRPQRRLLARNNFLASFPRYALEALGLVAVAVLGALLVLQRGSGSAAIPLLGAVALGAQRLLPALQQIYRGWASLKSNNSAMEFVLSMLDQPLPARTIAAQPLQSFQAIRLEQLNFRYSQDQPQILNEINLEIHRGERIGLIGNTGSGKSTMIDILMGLLVPSSGKVLVDGKDIHGNSSDELLSSWMTSIAHVPQSIYLSDSSIAENIAFGIPKNQINMDRVRKAASQAQLDGFLESMSQGFESFVGERGIRLSGGQRQRIGIARALYKNAQLLVFDEATSALDNETEESVMNSINSMSCELTVVMIAHRLSTVEKCDRLYRIDNGRLQLDNSYLKGR